MDGTLERDVDTLYLNNLLGVIRTSRDTRDKGHPVLNVTLDVGDLILLIYVTLINVGPHHPRFTTVSVGFRPSMSMTLLVVSVSSLSNQTEYD